MVRMERRHEIIKQNDLNFLEKCAQDCQKRRVVKGAKGVEFGVYVVSFLLLCCDVCCLSLQRDHLRFPQEVKDPFFSFLLLLLLIAPLPSSIHNRLAPAQCFSSTIIMLQPQKSRRKKEEKSKNKKSECRRQQKRNEMCDSKEEKTMF